MWMPSKNNFLNMINNCPTIPEYIIDYCFIQILFDFGFNDGTDYVIKFTDNVNNVHKVKIQALNNTLYVEPGKFLDSIYSPFIVEIFEGDGCIPLELPHCGDVTATKFMLHIQATDGYKVEEPIIPCCPPPAE